MSKGDFAMISEILQERFVFVFNNVKFRWKVERSVHLHFVFVTILCFAFFSSLYVM